ncbi:MAG: hypothetical protein HZA36_02230 [Parcubacteria group bacterium]|nr:hypothetical protein [Parcubacteria group bacterium]
MPSESFGSSRPIEKKPLAPPEQPTNLQKKLSEEGLDGDGGKPGFSGMDYAEIGRIGESAKRGIGEKLTADDATTDSPRIGDRIFKIGERVSVRNASGDIE